MTRGASPDGSHPGLRLIAPAAAMVDEFVETTQNTNKKLFLAN
jgi:hypothetical protein